MDVRLQLRALHDDLRSSFWFRPVLIILMTIGLFFALTVLDQIIQMAPLWPMSDDAARAILGSIATAMLSVVALTFSIIIVVLVLASQQFSPRILRNFARDHVSQNVLGICLGTFIYSVLVMTHPAQTPETPTLSILVAVLLALFSVGTLIQFIDHMTRTIRVSYMIAEISQQTIDLLPRLLSSTPAPQTADAAPSTPLDATGVTTRVAPAKSGYIQSIDLDMLTEIAQAHNLVIYLERATGDFVSQSSVLLQVQVDDALTTTLTRRLQETFEIGIERTMLDDLLFGPRQLVDMALKAISPAVNDPTTAVQCLDGLCDILVQAVSYHAPQPWRCDSTGALRLHYQPVTFADLLDLAVTQIRQYGRTDLAVTLRLIQVLMEVARVATNPQQRTLLRHQGAIIQRAAARGIVEPDDRQKINQAMQALARELQQPADSLLLAEVN